MKFRVCVDEIFRAPDYNDKFRAVIAASTDKCPEHPELADKDDSDWWGEEEGYSLDIGAFCEKMNLKKSDLKEGMVFLMHSIEGPGINYTRPCKTAVADLYTKALTGK